MTMATNLKYAGLLTCLISSLAIGHPAERTPGKGAAGLEGVMLGQTAKAKLEVCKDSRLEQEVSTATRVQDACYAEILTDIRTTLAKCEKQGNDQQSLCAGFKSVIETIDHPDLHKAIAE